MKKLDYRGVSHLIVPLMVVLVVAVAGTFMLVSSHADSVSDPVATTAKTKCKSGRTLVNALPKDFIGGAYKSAAKRGHGLICVKSIDGRERVSAPNLNTISAMHKCPGSSTFAYDSRNPDGTGYRKARWKVRSHFGGQEGGLKTYYCIKKKDLFKSLSTLGHSSSTDQYNKDVWKTGDWHGYHFFPAYDLQKGCNADAAKHTGCRASYFFSYYFTKDESNR